MKLRVLFLITTLLILPLLLVAQRPIEKRSTYEKYEFPKEYVQSSMKNQYYSIRAQFVDDWPDERKQQIQQDLYNTIDLPDMQKIEFNYEQSEEFVDQFYGLLITVDYGKYERDSKFQYYGETNNIYWNYKVKMPVKITYKYRNLPDESYSYDFTDGLDAEGYFTYSSDPMSEDKAYHPDVTDGLIKKVNDLCFGRLNEHFEYKNKAYYPSTSNVDVVLYSLKKKKMDFSKMDEGCEIAKQAIEMISGDDIVPPDDSKALMDQAIVKFREVADEYAGEKKIAYYPLYNIMELQTMKGDFNGAIATAKEIHKFGAYYKMLVSTDRIKNIREDYKRNGLAFQ